MSLRHRLVRHLRSLAVSLVSAGMAMTPMTMSPLAAWLVSDHDWRTSIQIVALVVLLLMAPRSQELELQRFRLDSVH